VSRLLIGVLALQGGFQRHLVMLERIGVRTIEVRYAHQLEKCDALVLPGGESTTMTHLLLTENLWEPIHEFVQAHPVFGTCAGAILLSQNAHDTRVKPFGVLDVEADRNAYGRQVESFITILNLAEIGCDAYEAVFIRAPQLKLASNRVQVLGSENSRAVLLRQNNVLAATFHPELTQDPAIHRYFVESMVRKSLTITNKAQANV